MNSRIMICPSCGYVAALVELPGETTADLVHDLAPDGLGNEHWTCKSYWCPTCDMAVILACPLTMPVGDRRELVGLPRDLLKVEADR